MSLTRSDVTTEKGPDVTTEQVPDVMPEQGPDTMPEQGPDVILEKRTAASHMSKPSWSSSLATDVTLTPEDVEDFPESLKKVDDFQESPEKVDLHEDLEAQCDRKRRYASLRYKFLNIYRRLFSLVFLANLAMFIVILVKGQNLLSVVNATAANLLACGLARQPLVVNAIFKGLSWIPKRAPLRLRRIAANAYHYGGVHSGCGIAACVWYIGLVGLASRAYWFPQDSSDSISTAAIVLIYAICIVLLTIIAVAYPAFRFRKHDYFELTHRFLGWLIVALFLALLLVFSNEARQAQNMTLGRYLIQLPAFWFEMVIIAAIIHPWLLLTKVQIQPEYLSTHAVRLHFDYTASAFGKVIQLSRHPLRDWHSFATFPDYGPDDKGFSCIVSKAGDWTTKCIKDQPTYLWKRGVLTYGFIHVMRVFHKVVVVTTGSGIGPCLSFLSEKNRPELRVVWQTRSPVRTYGPRVMNLAKKLDSDLLVIDTDKDGRVDMLPTVQRLVRDFGAEAVCVISNPVLTKNIVFELESRGVPAFGPIWDS